MTFTYSPAQIALAKKLVKWAGTQMPEPMARREVAGIIKGNPLPAIESAMKQSSCTSIKAMKDILKHKKSKLTSTFTGVN